MRELVPPLELTGLTPAPSQVCGAFRLIPLLRDAPCDDVRLSRWAVDPDVAAVPLPGGDTYVAFVPHGLRLSWGTAVGAQISAKDEAKWRHVSSIGRLRQKNGKNALRFLPRHVAMEGLLAVSFAPPAFGWAELSDFFQRFGLGHRQEDSVYGEWIPGFEDALRTFEIHPGQVGSLVFTADALMSAFVVPMAEDYRRLHRAMLEDFYGDLMYQYAVMHPRTGTVQPVARCGGAASIADLRASVARMRDEWAAFTHSTMLGDWVDRPLRREISYRLGDMRLERFITELDPALANHIGERLLRPDGELLYLNTMRLSASQSKRVHLLMQLSDHHWHLESAAAALRTDVPSLIARIEARGFGYLINHSLREQAAKARRGLGS